MPSDTFTTLPKKNSPNFFSKNFPNFFKKKIIPGERLYLKTQLHSWKRGIAICSGKGTVNEELACSAEFTLVLPEKIKDFAVKS